jgi:hypothetical protein
MKIETSLDLVNAITDLFNACDENMSISEKEVDANLREMGYNPEQIEKDMQAIAEQALAASPLNRINKESDESFTCKEYGLAKSISRMAYFSRRLN